MANISRASARAIIIEDGRMLVEWYAPRAVCFSPGGTIEPGESLRQTIERELKEELGIPLHRHRRLSWKILQPLARRWAEDRAR